MVVRNISRDNGDTGISFLEGSIVIFNVSRDNGGDGIGGVTGNCPSTVIGNLATGNGDNLDLDPAGDCTDDNNTAP